MDINLKDYPAILNEVLNSLDDGVLIIGSRIADTISNDSAKHFLSNCLIEADNKKVKVQKNIGAGSKLLLNSNLDTIIQLFKNYPSGNQILNIVKAKDEDGDNISFYRKVIVGKESANSYNIVLIRYNLSEIENAKIVTSLLNLVGDDIKISGKDKEGDVITIIVKLKSLNLNKSTK